MSCLAAVTCGLAPIPQFGMIVYDRRISGNTTEYGDRVTYKCLPPHVVVGDPRAECTASGTWTKTPECQGMTVKKTWATEIISIIVVFQDIFTGHNFNFLGFRMWANQNNTCIIMLWHLFLLSTNTRFRFQSWSWYEKIRKQLTKRSAYVFLFFFSRLRGI